MKPTSVLLVAIACTALLCAATYAATSSATQHADSGRTSRRESSVLPKKRKPSAPAAPLNNSRKPAPRSTGVESKRLTNADETNRAMPVRVQKAVPHTVLSVGSMRHRSANPAVVAAARSSQVSGSASINGSRVYRRP
jgi:hypothetical protein